MSSCRLTVISVIFIDLASLFIVFIVEKWSFSRMNKKKHLLLLKLAWYKNESGGAVRYSIIDRPFYPE